MRTMLLFVISALSLTSCGSEQLLNPTLPKAERQTQRAICPTPSNLTPAQSGQVADALEAVPPQHRRGIEILATEWDRLNVAAQNCNAK